ncbi:CoA-transferase family III domain-containing protein [Thelonectria olida]|uniref:CoA-transferase family III domain-containing protein n=1 Tax=Thelonectria olida TaxID=1576542 RepID=A0A9P9ALE9_9HYPO|nr:CoA-transferase family III domain-containing protein [Thelonectria olida]
MVTEGFIIHTPDQHRYSMSTSNHHNGAASIKELNILTPNAMLGYGYNSDHFWYGIAKYKPDAIIVDSGSTDGGPYKLGMGKMTCGRGSYVRDLEPILSACFHHKIKVLIGSVGGDGSNKHLSEMLAIVTEIAERQAYSFKIATIEAGIKKELIKSRIVDGRVSPCGPLENLASDEVDSAVDVVAQMGAEPFIEALKEDPDIILGGRCYDPAPFAAFSISRGVLPDVAWHMGKIMECGGICAVPKGRSMIATVRKDSFDLTPLSPAERCTPLSVAAHTLYEKTRPDRLPGPGGVLNLDNAKYTQITDKTCRISGARFMPTPYQIKLEGVAHLGYRTIFIGGIRDPILIAQINDFLERVREYSHNLFPELDKSEKCRLIYHVYGQNGVMGPLEPVKSIPHEIAVMGEVVAPTAELSHTIANNVRASILHFAYPGQMATTGNFASPLSPHEQDAGAVFKFSLYHLVDLNEGEEIDLFPIKFCNVGSSRSPPTPAPTISEEKMTEMDNGELAPTMIKSVPSGDAPMSQLACIIRSKNSGPFEMTFDIMFDQEDVYKRVKAANVLTNNVIKSLYQVKDEDILTNMYFDPAFAWKCTIKRPWPQGSVGELDTLGTQQHAPLLDVYVPAVPSVQANGATNGVKNIAINGITNGAKHHASRATHDTTNGQLNGTTNDVANGVNISRESFTAHDIVNQIWSGLELPPQALDSLSLPGGNTTAPALPSSYKIGALAQSSIALSALAAAQIHALRTKGDVPQVRVPLEHSVVEFKSERLYILDGKPAPSPWGPIGGLHKTSDGYVRVHDSFPNHAHGILDMMNLPKDATREQLSKKIANWASIDLEATATAEGNLATYALRSYRQWDSLPQSKAISSFPISVAQISPTGDAGLPEGMLSDSSRCLRGLRVLEMSRVIAAPLCGKTLAAHGADVIWVTSPNLPDLPTMDRDFGRGKRTVQLDIHVEDDKARLLELIKTCDVFVQGFRPGSLAAYGLSPEELVKINPNITVANMSAFGPVGPWAGRRGYDSLVQTCSGMNISEAEHAGKDEVARPTPCQALDHAGGYMLATGVIAAIYRRATQGGSWRVDVSLAGVMKYLRSLGQYPGVTGFAAKDFESVCDVPGEYFEERDTGFGVMKAIRHSAEVKGCEVGWEVMPKPLGYDTPEWL